MTMRETNAARTAEDRCELLLDIAAKRDRTAFAAIFGFYAPRLKAFMMRSGMTAPVAEEIVQETMLLVWRKASYFDPRRAGVSTWIYTIARNVRIDRLRREGRPLSVAASFDPSDEPEAPVSGEAAMLVSEREERVRAALSFLSAEQAEIIRLSYFSDKTQTDIANELDIPLGTVKSRVRLALGRLRHVLEDLK